MSGRCRDSSRSVSFAQSRTGPYATASGSVWAGCVCHGCGLHALDSVRNGGGPWGRAPAQWLTSPGVDLMTEVIDRLVVAMNAHDLDAAAGLIHEDYRSEQPAHPGR